MRPHASRFDRQCTAAGEGCRTGLRKAGPYRLRSRQQADRSGQSRGSSGHCALQPRGGGLPLFPGKKQVREQPLSMLYIYYSHCYCPRIGEGAPDARVTWSSPRAAPDRARPPTVTCGVGSSLRACRATDVGGALTPFTVPTPHCPATEVLPEGNLSTCQTKPPRPLEPR
jgi:hypothetical protein